MEYSENEYPPEVTAITNKAMRAMSRLISPKVEDMTKTAQTIYPSLTGLICVFCDSEGKVATAVGTVDVDTQMKALESAKLLLEKIMKATSN